MKKNRLSRTAKTVSIRNKGRGTIPTTINTYPQVIAIKKCDIGKRMNTKINGTEK